MQHCKQSGLLLALTATIAFSSVHVRADDSAEPIRIVTNNWASQQVLSHITGTLLSNAGYNVEFHPADTRKQFVGLGNGDLHVQMEVWQGDMEAPFKEQLSRERIVDAGTYTMVTREDWWYPDYMEALCPGLPDWHALNACAELLSTDATRPQGQFLSGPQDWGRPDRERIEALGLNFQIVHVADQTNLWGALDYAWQRKLPIVMLNWIPNWTELPYPGKFVEFPMRDPEGTCDNDPAWGENPQLTHDCGSARFGWLKKVTWSGFAEQWSCAAELIRAVDLDNRQIVAAAALAEVDEMSPEQAALRWIDENSDVVGAWMPACASSLKVSESVAASNESSQAVATVDTAAVEAMAKSRACMGCHAIDNKLVGPAFKDVAAKYQGHADAEIMLVGKVLQGGVGNWGEIPMPANSMSEDDAHTLVKWVLSQ